MMSSTKLCGPQGVERLIYLAFEPTVSIVEQYEIAQGKGTFSDVYRVHLQHDGPASSGVETPTTVVAKLPASSRNREAAAVNGAYLREELAYRELLPRSPIEAPACLAAATEGATAAFLLDDLTRHRFVDQIDGLSADDALRVGQSLTRFHRFWSRQLSNGPEVAGNKIRTSTVSGLTTDRLLLGLKALRQHWPELDDDLVTAFDAVVDNRERLVERFSAASTEGGWGTPPTLCHGDPRADNLCFDASGTPILFDWQQIAVQFGEADLAWMMATSLEPATRRACDEDLLSSYGADVDRYRLGFVLPGMAALMLAQRDAEHPRTKLFILTSLRRIATALVDYDVAKAA